MRAFMVERDESGRNASDSERDKSRRNATGNTLERHGGELRLSGGGGLLLSGERLLFFRGGRLLFFWGVALIVLSLICLLTIDGCAPETSSSDDAAASDDAAQATETEEQKLERAVQSTIDAMPVEQKVAQLFFITPEALTSVGVVVQAGPSTEQALAAHPVGGLIYFAQNLENPDQTRTMLETTQSFAQTEGDVPIFLAVDEEGGTVSRIGGNPGFPIENVGDMAAIGATGDPAEAKTVATTISDYLRDLGFNTDFAPVADIATNPDGSMMQRSFGDDPELVASMVTAEVQGFLESDMLCAVKHFPGIGDVVGDPHTGEISSDLDLGSIEAFELAPFEAAIDAGVPFVMVGHLKTPAATYDSLPASLSSSWIQETLRDLLHYDGIVITDSLCMDAVADIYSAERIGVEVIKAGADMILMPEDFDSCYQGLLDAVNSGEVSTDRIDESLARILRIKLRYLVE